MIRYGYDDNGFYSGQVWCQPNPMLPGAFLHPANTTNVAPPNPEVAQGTDTANKAAQWNGTSWDEADDPQIPFLLEQQKISDTEKTLVFYRNEAGKDKMVLSHEIKSAAWDYNASEAVFDGALMSDPANANIGYYEFDLPMLPMSKDVHDLSDKEFDGVDSLVTRTSAEYVNAVAAKVLENTQRADSLKSIVFYRTESGKDKVVLLIAQKNFVWDYGNSEEPLYNGSPVSGNADVGYAELNQISEMTFDSLGVANQIIDDTDPNNKVLAVRSGTDYDADRTATAWKALRYQRDAKIGAVEWMRSRHNDEIALSVTTTLDNTQYTTLLTYIQDLRDLPGNTVDPIAFLASPSWPTEPSF